MNIAQILPVVAPQVFRELNRPSYQLRSVTVDLFGLWRAVIIDTTRIAYISMYWTGQENDNGTESDRIRHAKALIMNACRNLDEERRAMPVNNALTPEDAYYEVQDVDFSL